MHSKNTDNEYRQTTFFSGIIGHQEGKPGPGAYDLQQTASPQTKQNLDLQARFETTKKVFCREWCKDHQNKESPGPVYDPKMQIKTKDFKFPKLDRGLLNREKNDKPGPVSYNVTDSYLNDEGHNLKGPKIKGGTLTTQERIVDFTRFNS